jgi:hypothetical protein
LEFEYFTISTGIAIILIGILGLLNIPTFYKGSWVRFATYVIFGAASCLLSLIAFKEEENTAVSFGRTAWPLIVIAIFLFISKYILRATGSGLY